MQTGKANKGGSYSSAQSKCSCGRTMVRSSRSFYFKRKVGGGSAYIGNL